MRTRPLYIGIDLGTTNSTAAVFDGEQLQIIRNRHGASLTPSVVRYDAKGNAMVGERARRLLDSDPDNTRAEFKRLMGSDHVLNFAAMKQSRSPEQLSAEVLKALRQDIADQVGQLPEQAVISVPALFELPQISATAEAARLAGFSRIEVIQEPVASAISAGWSVENAGKNWLVYDLGGGTFDVSLLETKEGLLRVVGHDGDNFLGGRDMDAAIVNKVLERLSQQGVQIDRSDPAHATALRRLRFAAEEAKIELSRAKGAGITLPNLFSVNGSPVDVDIWLEASDFDEIVLAIVDRSIMVCLRLLAQHGLQSADLDRVVLVGGPTVIPLLRQRIKDRLGLPFGEGLDPMTLVAQGAALYAATAGVDGRPKAAAPVQSGPRVWLQHPAVSSDLSPFVVGRVLEGAGLQAIKIRRMDGLWQSDIEKIDGDGTFAIPVSLNLRQANVFSIHAIRKDGSEVETQPAQFKIMHGITISDPPLSRSIGVATADDTVHVYFERGSPLPMRRSYNHETVEAVHPQDTGFILKIPIVQGEFGRAHLCRLVGTILVPSQILKTVLPAGSVVEVSLELDRGGRLTARALIPSLNQSFEQVAQLLVPHLSIEELGQSLEGLKKRVILAQNDTIRRGDINILTQLNEALQLISASEQDLKAAKGGDVDAGEKARRAAIEVDGMLSSIEAAVAWPALEARAQRMVAWSTSWIARYGDSTERKVFADAVSRLQQLMTARSEREVERQIHSIEQLGIACYYRAPGSWETEFRAAAARVSEMTDVRSAQQWVKAGEEALRRQDVRALEPILHKLWALLPPNAHKRKLSHGSGVR